MHLLPRGFFASLFGAIFQLLSLALIGQSFIEFYIKLVIDKNSFTTVIISSINTFIIALAMFELGIGINKEFKADDDSDAFYSTIRRTITRFVGTVCIALVLEALIMIIKYSQLDLAGNLWYPVGILCGSSLLLMSLGLFLHFTHTSDVTDKS